MRRAIIAAGWERTPARVALREFSVIALPYAEPSWGNPHFWETAAAELDVELSASVLVVHAGGTGKRGTGTPRGAAAGLPVPVQGLFRGCLDAQDDAAFRRAARAADRQALSSRVLTDHAEAARRCDAVRRAGRAIVFTNGVFDMLHLGHVRLLQAARALGDFLVVGINSDASAKGLKGKTRPVVPQFARAELVAAVRGVDLCVIFDDPDPRALLRALRPAVLAKGSEYSLSAVVGRRLVEDGGGRVVLIPHVQGWSATEVIRRARGRGM